MREGEGEGYAVSGNICEGESGSKGVMDDTLCKALEIKIDLTMIYWRKTQIKLAKGFSNTTSMRKVKRRK